MRHDRQSQDLPWNGSSALPAHVLEGKARGEGSTSTLPSRVREESNNPAPGCPLVVRTCRAAFPTTALKARGCFLVFMGTEHGTPSNVSEVVLRGHTNQKIKLGN